MTLFTHTATRGVSRHALALLAGAALAFSMLALAQPAFAADPNANERASERSNGNANANANPNANGNNGNGNGNGNPGGPAGNNGTIKVDGNAFDTHPNNEPHVDCLFQIDFYGFDQGDLWASLTFEAHPPTGGGMLLSDSVFIGEDSNAGGGSQNGHDASAGNQDHDGTRVYDLSSALAAYAPHPNQGYHVRLTVQADGAQGARVKHKAFWVAPCATTPTPTGTQPGGTQLGGRGTPRPGGTIPNTATTSTGGSAPLAPLAVVVLLTSLATLAAQPVVGRIRANR